jgi:signal transduction histidine kinase
LQLISGNLQLIKLLGGISENVAKRVDIALAGIERGAKLSAHLLAFARSQPLQASVVNPAEVLLDMEHMLRRVLGPRATIMTDIEDGLWSIRVDPSQLTNVILNLAINARDAMLEGGTLTIRAANVPKTSPRLSNLACSDYVMIEVADTGCGMPAAVRERAFESFFTTKPTGQGSGLGLSMASGFIQQSGGEIVIDSKPGHGTSVRIFLRRSEAESETEAGATVGFKAVLLPSGL